MGPKWGLNQCKSKWTLHSGSSHPKLPTFGGNLLRARSERPACDLCGPMINVQVARAKQIENRPTFESKQRRGDQRVAGAESAPQDALVSLVRRAARLVGQRAGQWPSGTLLACFEWLSDLFGANCLAAIFSFAFASSFLAPTQRKSRRRRRGRRSGGGRRWLGRI